MNKKESIISWVLLGSILAIIILISIISSCIYLNNEGKKQTDTIQAQTYEPEKKSEVDFYTVYNNTFIKEINHIKWLTSIFIILPSAFFVTNHLNKKNSIYSKDDKEYKNNIKKMLIDAYKPVWVVLGSIIICLLVSYLISGGFHTSLVYKNGVSSIVLMRKPFLYILLYLIKMVMYSIIYVNIILSWGRFFKKYLPTLLASLASIAFLELIIKFVLEKLILESILKLSLNNSLSINGLFALFVNNNVATSLIVIIFLMYVSIFVVLYLYQDKEKFKVKKNLIPRLSK